MHRYKENGKCYIGVTPKTVKNDVDKVCDVHEAEELMMRRWKGHLRSAEKGSTLAFHNAIRKYGHEAFEHVVLDICVTLEDVFLREIKRIEEYKSLTSENGYNMTTGGDCVILSDDQKLRHKEATKLAMWRKDVRERHLSVQRNLEVRQRHSTASKLSWQDETVRKNHRDGWDASTKVRRFYVEQIDLRTSEVVATFASVCEASRKTGIHKSGILSYLRGDRRHAGGFLWHRR